MRRADAYAALGLDGTADIEEVKSAWRMVAKSAHPDAGGDSEQFIRMHTAYQILTGEMQADSGEAEGEGDLSVVAEYREPVERDEEVLFASVDDPEERRARRWSNIAYELASDRRTSWLLSRRLAVLGAVGLILRYLTDAFWQIRTLSVIGGDVWRSPYDWYPIGGDLALGLSTFFGYPALGFAAGVGIIVWLFSPAIRSVRYDRWRAWQNLRLSDAPAQSVVAGRVALALPLVSALLFVVALVLWLAVIVVVGFVAIIVLSAFFGSRS